MLQPFINYYGGKARMAHLYPPPKYDTIVEPFAGAAGYAMRYHHRNVILVEKNKVLYEMWRWLIEEATQDFILKLPAKVDDVRELDAPEGAKILIGFRMTGATVAPAKTRSKWEREYNPTGEHASFWCAKTRTRLARQVEHIKHWKVILGDYTLAKLMVKRERVTWFIDPPYQRSGTHYKESSKNIDFPSLGKWCQSLSGQVIVCEQEGADWLPFQPIWNRSRGGQRGAKSTRETVWLSDGDYRAKSVGFGITDNLE